MQTEEQSNEEQIRHATLNSVIVLLQMVRSGKVPYEKLQALIDEGKDKLSRKHQLRAAAREERREARADFPRLVRSLIDFIGEERAGEFAVRLHPFLDLKPALKTGVRDSSERALEAVFWKRSHMDRARFVTPRTIKQSDVGLRYLANSLLKEHLGVKGSSEEAMLCKEVTDCLVARYIEGAEDRFISEILATSVANVAFVIALQPERADAFKPLRTLWKEGIFPIGFDGDGHLLVLLADDPS